MFGKMAVTKDRTQELLEALKRVAKADVLVGIPESESAREEADQNGTVTNVQLAYIHTHGVRAPSMREEMQPTIDQTGKYSKAYQMYIQSHGSPLMQVPPRPIIEPAIEHPENRERIVEQMKKALELYVDGKTVQAERQLERAGQTAANAAKAWFRNEANGWPPNSPKTAKAKGSDRPLIDTGALRQSITYVIRNK